MKKIMRVMGVIGVNPTFAFDRNAFVGGRITVNSNFTRNGSTVVLNSGPVQVGTTNHSLPAYQSIAQTVAQIQALKLQLKNFSPK